MVPEEALANDPPGSTRGGPSNQLTREEQVT